MFLTRKSLLALSLSAAVIATASAQQLPQEILDCADLKRDAARLACFDREVARAIQSPASVASTPTPSAPPAPTTGPVAPTPPISAKSKEDEFGLSGDLARKRQNAAEKAQPTLDAIEAKIAKVSSRPYGELVFELDNGQVWQQPEKKNGFEIKVGEHIRITKGALGSFFLVADSGANTRVRRVR